MLVVGSLRDFRLLAEKNFGDMLILEATFFQQIDALPYRIKVYES